MGVKASLLTKNNNVIKDSAENFQEETEPPHFGHLNENETTEKLL